ncbi:MAG: hypothetical protein SF028_10395 [Candidatus Sumerlaeia bacterium]|nr:hypothetical protein [Candidatus Sumerlaeia bacterium]
MALFLFARRLMAFAGVALLALASYAWWGSPESPLRHLAAPGAWLLAFALATAAAQWIIGVWTRIERRRERRLSR